MSVCPIVRVILAAGAGTRMGTTKALLDFHGRTALELIVELPCPDGRDVVVTGHDAEAVAREALRLGARPVFNDAWRLGQMSSLLAGLSVRRDTEALLLHPVDLPLVARSTIEACLVTHARHPDRIVVPSHAMRRGHPVILPSRLVDELERSTPQGSLREFLRRHGDDILHVEVDDPWIRDDLDHPEDFRRALREYERRVRGETGA